jgi:hypothetical protein
VSQVESGSGKGPDVGKQIPPVLVMALVSVVAIAFFWGVATALGSVAQYLTELVCHFSGR